LIIIIITITIKKNLDGLVEVGWVTGVADVMSIFILVEQ